MNRLKTWWDTYRIEGCLYLGFLLLYLCTSWGCRTPLMYADEAGYIGWVRQILFGTSTGIRYLPGYSLLLMPIFLITDEITVAYPLILLVNALLGASIPVLFYRLIPYLAKELSWKRRLMVSVLGSLYPPFLLYGNMALCEILLIVLFLALTLSIARLSFEPQQWGNWLAVVVLAGYLALTHARAFVLLPVVFLTLLLIAHKKVGKEKMKPVYLALGVCGVLVVVCALFFITNSSNNNAVHLQKQILRFFTKRGFRDTLYVGVAQGLYLVMASFGVVVTGVWYAVKRLLQKSEDFITVGFLLCSFFAVMFLSAVYMSHHAKPVHIIYGRYNTFAQSGVLLLGILSMCKVKKLPKWIWIIPVLMAGITIYKQTPDLATGGLGGVDMETAQVFGIYLYKLFFTRFTAPGVIGLFAVLVVVLLWLCKKHRNAAFGLLFLLFLSTIGYAKYDYFLKWNEVRMDPSEVGEFLAQYAEDGIEVEVIPQEANGLGRPWEYSNYEVYYPNLSIALKDGGQPLLLTREANKHLPLLVMEQDTHIYLWSQDPDLTEQYKNRLLPNSFPADYGEYRSQISLEEQEAPTIPVRITNLGKGFGWLCYDAVRDIRSAVRLAVEIVDEKGTLRQERLDLPHSLFYGESCVLSLPALEDGVYTVHLELVQDFQTWFSQKGDTGAITISLTVKDGLQSARLLPEYEWMTGDFRRISFSVLRETEEILNTTYRTNLVGFDENYTTRGGAVICHISCLVRPQDRYLVLHTAEETALQPALQVNGVPLDFVKQEGNAYYFELQSDWITDIQIVSDVVTPAGVPRWFTSDHIFRPIGWLSERTGIGFYERGVCVDYLEIVGESV